MCADPRHPNSCQGPKAWDLAEPTRGPGCGVEGHGPGCLCDVWPKGEK